jgi:hypothetical protein
LQRQYANRRWCLTVDVDELLVYPFTTTPSVAGADRLAGCINPQFRSVLLDMARGPLGAQPTAGGQNPFELRRGSGGGGMFQRTVPETCGFKAACGPRILGDTPKRPRRSMGSLVKWRKDFVYVSSTTPCCRVAEP